MRTFSLLMLLVVTTSVIAQDRISSPETARSLGVATDREKTFTSSSSLQFTVSCNNAVVTGSSPLVMEIRDGGCSGRLKARFEIDSGDNVTGFATKGDFVRIKSSNAQLPCNYLYDIGMNIPGTGDATEYALDATGDSQVTAVVHNNQSGNTNVKLKALNGSTVQTDSIVPPQFNSSYNDRANKVCIKSEAGSRIDYSGAVNFSSPPQ